jgi:hypothetical protein
MGSGSTSPGEIPRFDRGFFSSPEPITCIGEGDIGGKASGLLLIRDLLPVALEASRFPDLEISVPKMVVIRTKVFDAFMARNGLYDAALASTDDQDLTRRFLSAELPAGIVGDLRALVEEVRTPLAVRSSSLLEDALERPFAGVYETKMVPNNQPDVDQRFARLVEAIKFVYASTFFRDARDYVQTTELTSVDEKMAVIVQEVIGARHNDRYYPHVSGVGRSYSFFPSPGTDPRDGVVNLALGLGKTIVDGGTSWIYSPVRPLAPPPFGSVKEMLGGTQLRYWAVNMGRPPAYDPLTETEYLVQADLAEAEYDGTLELVASTYDTRRDSLVPGTATPGPRVLNFRPLLSSREPAVSQLIREWLTVAEQALGQPVETEFALTLPPRGETTWRFGVLQVRPMMVSEEEVELDTIDSDDPRLLLASDRVMGNGLLETIQDIVYVKPEAFSGAATRQIAAELGQLNRLLIADRSPFLLVGFGRWGSSDPWLGIPVTWGQIGGARAIVEATLPAMDVEPSQGAHFFHNLMSFRVPYLCVRHGPATGPGQRAIDWGWLDAQRGLQETEHVRHVRLDTPLLVKVDGRHGRGAIWHA